MKVTKLMVAMVAALGIAGVASAATISWSSSTAATEGGWGQNLSTGLFDTSGAFKSAENVGGSAYTFDGIDFTAGSTVFSGTGSVFHDDPATYETELSGTGTYGAGGAADTVSLTDLISGHSYRIQALVFDGRNSADEPTAPGRTMSVDGVDQGQYASGVFNVTWGEGMLLTGTFTADDTTQDFTLEAFNAGTSYGGQLNALAVHTTAIPEPATLGMFGVFGAAVLFIRRKLAM